MEQKRNLKIHYFQFGEGEHAHIETIDGYYLCTVEQTDGEGKRRFRTRARGLKEALEWYQGPLVTLSPDYC